MPEHVIKLRWHLSAMLKFNFFPQRNGMGSRTFSANKSEDCMQERFRNESKVLPQMCGDRKATAVTEVRREEI